MQLHIVLIIPKSGWTSEESTRYTNDCVHRAPVPFQLQYSSPFHSRIFPFSSNVSPFLFVLIFMVFSQGWRRSTTMASSTIETINISRTIFQFQFINCTADLPCRSWRTRLFTPTWPERVDRGREEKKKREKKTGVRKGFIAVRVWFTFYFALDFKRGENRERER